MKICNQNQNWNTPLKKDVEKVLKDNGHSIYCFKLNSIGPFDSDFVTGNRSIGFLPILKNSFSLAL